MYGNGYYYGIDSYYLLLVLPAFLLCLWAQFRVNSTYKKYAQVYAARGMTASQAARAILDANGLYNVEIQPIAGQLTDNYDPRTNVINLSEATIGSSSIAAIGVAAHEVGHAVQYARGYGPIKLRTAIVPVCQIGSSLAMPLLLLGIVMSFGFLVKLGIVFFGLSVVFQLVTLPVEFNASRRALATLDERGILSGDELSGAKKVLSAAALTYVAAMALALAQFLRLLAIFGGNSRRRN